MEKTSGEPLDTRSTWPVRKFKVGGEPTDDLSSSTTVSERFAMMWELAERAWLLTGREFPDYERADAPGRVIRGD